MSNLIGLIAALVLMAGLWTLRNRTWAQRHRLIWRGLLAAGYLSTFFLAFRFDARTYPGVYLVGPPHVLNDVFNSDLIFVVGGLFVCIGLGGDVAACLPWRRMEGAARLGANARNVSLALASLIALYGLVIAALFQRLP